jgi:hypothetical protein
MSSGDNLVTLFVSLAMCVLRRCHATVVWRLYAGGSTMSDTDEYFFLLIISRKFTIYSTM